ncbi:MAG: NADH-quinone oxidoreductase subunit N [Gemmatimonadota bacterium]
MNAFDLSTPSGLTIAMLPEVLLTIGAMVVLLVISWRHSTAADSRLAGWLSLASLAVSAAGLGWLWSGNAQSTGIPLMIALDNFRYTADAILLIAAAGTVLLSMGYLERERLLAPEYYCLLLLSTVGMMFFAGAQDFIVLFLGLEVMSVAVYILAGYNRASAYSAEAALKYFLIGAFASGFLLYGIALVYGATGSTNLVIAGAQLSSGHLTTMASLGLGLLLIGFGFKVAAVPFHSWAPDVYDGSPTPVTAFMATGVKAAAFVALARVLLETFSSAASQWQPIIATLAVATMVLGNLVALAQPTLKRMLAYSSIAHAGYLLVALWPNSPLGAAALLLYLLAYSLTTLVAFGLLAALGRNGEREVTLADIRGLSVNRPWMALAMAISMLSLLGFPGTVGFMGKWYILTAVVAQGSPVLAVVLVLTSVVSAGYYLPVIMAMYMRAPQVPLAHSENGLASTARVAVAIAAVCILVLGVWPTGALHIVEHGAAALAQLIAPTVAGQ